MPSPSSVKNLKKNVCLYRDVILSPLVGFTSCNPYTGEIVKNLQPIKRLNLAFPGGAIFFLIRTTYRSRYFFSRGASLFAVKPIYSPAPVKKIMHFLPYSYPCSNALAKADGRKKKNGVKAEILDNESRRAEWLAGAAHH